MSGDVWLFAGAAVYVALLWLAAWAWRRRARRVPRMRTADAARIERDARAALRRAAVAGAGRVRTLGSDYVSPERATRIRAHAINTARRDRTEGRRSANPHTRHTKAAGLWATEYEAAWTTLEWAATDSNVIPIRFGLAASRARRA